MPGLSRRQLLRARRRLAAKAIAPAPPRHLHALAASPALVTLAWSPAAEPRGRRPAKAHQRPVYEVLRDGRAMGRTTQHRFADHTVQPLRIYRYAVRVREGKRVGPPCRAVSVRTPALPPSRPPVGQPAGPPPLPSTLTPAMVDRLFWRAGFGPSPADRQQWTGQPVSALVDHFLTTPYDLVPGAVAPSYRGNPIDPLASDPELQMEWLDRMQRATNPLVERLTFFWHRHWAVSKDSGIPSAALLAYRDRLRRYSDFAANPTASFNDLALEMTTQDAAMSQFLTGYLNTRRSPNENYAREFMELFTLGVTNIAGQPNYTQTDVHELARAFTGYSLSQGAVSFMPALADTTSKTIFGHTGAFDAPAAVQLVLSHPSHPIFLVAKLWSEFIRTPIPGDALTSLTSAYTASGRQIAPVVRGILSHPLIFESLSEPNLIKPPVIYTVGVLRSLGAPLKDTWQTDALRTMEQQPYHPPNVAGWEGGLSWLNTTTSVARFDLVVRCQSLLPAVDDLPGETAPAAYDRAYAMAGTPWLSAAVTQQLQRYAATAPAASSAQRRERIYALVAFMLGGPDGQVM